MSTALKSLTFAVLVLGLLGCNATNPVDAPAVPPAAVAKQGPQPLPFPDGPVLDKDGEVTGPVTVAGGGQLILCQRHGHSSYTFVLTFGPGAVANDTTLSILGDKKSVSARFGPDGMRFLIPGSLSMKAHGLKLPSTDSTWLVQNLKLLYQNPATGEWEPVPSDGFTVDLASGSIACTNGVINHFSRYGFGM